MAAHTQTHDDGFHEIQLNGKQLVFLFMAATVVSVVIFLCGVLVGRGVRAERTLVLSQADALAEPTADRTAPAPAPPPAVDVTKADTPPVADELSATNRLDKTDHPADEVKPDPPRSTAAAAKATAEKPAAPEKTPPGAVRSTPAAAPKPTAAAPSNAAATPRPAPPASAVKESTPPASATSSPAAAAPSDGSGYAVQVAAVNVRSEADAIAKRLTSKGYTTYVQAPGSGNVFRVRVGTFKTRREAETVAARLEKEEQIKPWVTR